jgi:hypothetical protein
MGYYYSLMVITMVIYQFSWCHILYTTRLRPWNACRRPPSWNARPTRFAPHRPGMLKIKATPKVVDSMDGFRGKSSPEMIKMIQMIKIHFFYWRKSELPAFSWKIHFFNLKIQYSCVKSLLLIDKSLLFTVVSAQVPCVS